MGNLRVSYTGRPGAWVGLIKQDKVIIWSCPHKHPNRYEETSYNTAATKCASAVLEALNDPEKTCKSITMMRSGYPTVVGSNAALNIYKVAARDPSPRMGALVLNRARTPRSRGNKLKLEAAEFGGN